MPTSETQESNGRRERTDTLSLALERLNQAVSLLSEQQKAVREERELLKQAVSTLLDHLDQMQQHWALASRNMASASRMEGELRETLAEAHRLIDKMPGKRHYAILPKDRM